MRLLEAIVNAHHAAPAGAAEVALEPDEWQEGLPLAVISCIDARLNRMLPARLGVPEEKLVWLRNAGNIITGPMSSTMRSLALACAVKGAKEIAVVGHTDCQVCKATMLNLTEALRKLGVERHRLPENLVEYFGLFASERQNVMRAAEIIRGSPIIGPKVPVHGLLLDLANGRLEWVVNGYETLGTVVSAITSAVHRAQSMAQETLAALPEFKLGEMKMPSVQIGEVELPKLEVGEVKAPQVEIAGFKLPEIKIGGATVDPNKWFAQVRTPEATAGGSGEGAVVAASGVGASGEAFDKTRRYKVIGSDQKVYGPINGLKILQWIEEGRIGWETPSQVEGSAEWRPLGAWSEAMRRLKVPLPPRLPGSGPGSERGRRSS